MTLPQAFSLAIQFQREGRIDEAISICNQILQHHPNAPEVLNTLAILLQQSGRLPEARDTLLQALTSNPHLPELHYNLANIHKDLGDFDLAIDAYRHALTLRPDFRPALNNLANALKETGQLPEAKELYKRTLSLHPDPRIAGSLLYLMYFDPDATPQDIARQHALWNQTYAQPLAHSNAPQPQNTTTARRLKIGYVSPDFRNHPVARFFLPLLSHHDPERFEIFCYSDVRRPDSMTARIQSLAHQWRDTTRLPDESLAQLIRQDQIDILVDLTMHMEGNRLLTFARKPAAVQLTYLAYAGTTGLTAIDYRFSDPHLDPPVASPVEPPGDDESIYSEKTLRLPTYWCYTAPPEAPNISPLPALTTGHITFGCLNNFSKINPQVLETWRSLLTQVPESRLILSSHQGRHRDQVINFFGQAQIAPHRIEFTPVLPFADYLAQYNRIDIALDPFPYPGGTTTLDALHMGVPIITLPAQTAVSRAGVTILQNLGLQDFIASSRPHYITLASTLAADTANLSTLRSTLRHRLAISPLANAKAFTQAVEHHFQSIVNVPL